MSTPLNTPTHFRRQAFRAARECMAAVENAASLEAFGKPERAARALVRAAQAAESARINAVKWAAASATAVQA
jgi:hypothetical protein